MLASMDLALALIVGGVSLISGFGAFLQGRREGRIKANWLELFSELVLAQVAGLGALFVGEWRDFPDALVCLIALIAASNGGAMMALARSALAERIKLKGVK